MRLGVVADIHSMEADASDMPEGLLTAFAGVDRIVACGDHVTGAALDRLAEVAPLTATRNPNSDSDGDGHALEEKLTFMAEGLTLGVLFSVVSMGIEVGESGSVTWPATSLKPIVDTHFGASVDLLLFGGTHTPAIGSSGGLTFVNPGSPRFATRTTAAIVEIEASGLVTAEIIDV